MKARPHQLLREAQKGTYAIPAFAVDSIQQVRGVLHAGDHMKMPVVLHVSHDERLWADAADAIAQSLEPAVLHVDFPPSHTTISRAFEAGIESFTIAPNEQHLAQQVRGRAGWVGAFFEKYPSNTQRLEDIDAMYTALPATAGAFTGRHYVLFDKLERLLRADRVVGVYNAELAAPSHVRMLAMLPLSTIVFRIDAAKGQRFTEEAAAAFVVDKMRPLIP